MRPAVFLWENYGPYHRDRLRAVAASGRRAIGIQYADHSATYDWETAADDLDIRTLGLATAARGHGWRLAWRLWRECRRIGRADVFLCHYEQGPVLAVAWALRLTGRRVLTMTDSKFDDYSRHLWREAAKKLFLKPYVGALTASSRSADYLRWLGIPVDRIALGYNCVSAARLLILSGGLQAPDGVCFDERDWVVVARLVPKKNVALAIEAYAQWLTRTAHPRDLHLCGSGPLEADLRALAARLGVADRVRFHGFVQSDAVARRLASSLALLLPSVEEQFGLVVIEAQALGLPVLVTPQVGASDVLVEAGVNGFLLEPDNPQGWAAAMLMLSEDEARWRRFALAARAGAPRGDVARFVQGVAALTA